MSAQTITKNGNLREIMVVGGSFTPINESIKTFNVKYNIWEVDQADEVILFGGTCALTSSVNSTIVESLRNLVVYNTKENNWKTVKEKAYDYAIDHTSIIYKGVLMTLNRRVFATVDVTGFKDILCFDLKNEKWFNKTTNGEIPEALYGSSSIRVNNQLYIVGGVIDYNQTIYQSSLIYSLDLNHFIWKKHTVLELISAVFGFLVHYNGYLIYSFGGRMGPSLSKTHIIDLKKFTLVNRIPSQSELESLKPKSKVAMIVRSTIGGLAGLMLLTIITYFVIKRIKGAIVLRRIPDYIPEPTSNGQEFNIDDPMFIFDDSQSDIKLTKIYSINRI
ncbi:hypothetical protein K502DRAFT_341205 [Neoconidiobolus thromboides FSU 785]|nr:hypothetical protein K502DRAFT_341205 [Neoconidiobolus thromboides FSU 785]